MDTGGHLIANHVRRIEWLSRRSGLVGLLMGVATACGSSEPAEAPPITPPPEVTRLVVVTQPAALSRSGLPFERAAVVQAQTLAGEPVRVAGRSVTVAIASGGGTLVGVATATTDADGRATFLDLGIAGIVGARTLSFETPGAPAVSSWAIMVRPGLPATITVLGGDQQQAPAASPLRLPVQVRVVDASGNVVPDAEVRYTVAAGGGSVSPAVDTTDATGTSTIDRWVMGPGVGVGTVQVLADRVVATVSAKSTGLIATAVSSSFTTCAVTAAAALRCWGWNQYGQLGDGLLDDRSRPAAAAPTLAVSAVATGLGFACALTTGGDVQCWGTRTRLGDGTTEDRPTPARVPLPARATAIASTSAQACAITEGQGTWCWGDNRYGEVGDGGTGSRLLPSRVAGTLQFVKLSAGAFSSCAVTGAGAAFCWGDGRYGAIGSGDTTSRLIPWPVAGGLSFSDISVGGGFACGIATDSLAYCWGYNVIGAVGDGTNTTRLVPTRVAGGHRFARVSAGLNHACAIASTGRAWCWGFADSGQLGSPQPFADANRPVEVAGGMAWRDISAGESNSCGVEVSGQVYCWGNNVYGQVGDGTRIPRYTPVAVLP